MRTEVEIPSSVIERWEKEAMDQKLPYTEFKEFLRMKKDSYRQSFVKETRKEKIFTNDACNKLTAYGQRVALETILSIPEVERVCKIAKIDFEELSERLSKGFADRLQKEMFESMRELWFAHLKERMYELRISKETLASFGIDWKVYKTFAFRQI